MPVRREIGQYHSIIFTLVRNPGAPDRRLHVLYLLRLGLQPAPFVQLIEYFVDVGRARALSWQRDTARTVGLFIDFLAAHVQQLKGANNPKIFAMFAEALVGGTLGLDGSDQSGLFWEPRTVSRATTILRSVTAFSDWLENRYGVRPINPWRGASVAEQIAFWRHLDKRNARSLLGYANYRSGNHVRALTNRTVTIRRKTTMIAGPDVKFFPADRIWDLLFQGFAMRGAQRAAAFADQVSLKDVLITILLHGGGLRESEPFHLYVSDVGVDPQNPLSAMVRLYHPEQGAAPTDYLDPLTGRYIHADREEYLRVRWQMRPRTLLEGRFKTGWKDLLLLDQRAKYAFVHWFPAEWGELFLTLFKLYIAHRRPGRCNHPFLFVSQKAGFAGDPYTVDSYRQAHARAVARIGSYPGQRFGHDATRASARLRTTTCQCRRR